MIKIENSCTISRKWCSEAPCGSCALKPTLLISNGKSNSWLMGANFNKQKKGRDRFPLRMLLGGCQAPKARNCDLVNLYRLLSRRHSYFRCAPCTVSQSQESTYWKLGSANKYLPRWRHRSCRCHIHPSEQPSEPAMIGADWGKLEKTPISPPPVPLTDISTGTPLGFSLHLRGRPSRGPLPLPADPPRARLAPL